MPSDETNVVPIDRGREIRCERIIAWAQAAIDIMTPQQQTEFWDYVKYLSAILPEREPAHAE